MFISYLQNEQKQFCTSQGIRRINVVKTRHGMIVRPVISAIRENNCIPFCPTQFVPFQELQGMKQSK